MGKNTRTPQRPKTRNWQPKRECDNTTERVPKAVPKSTKLKHKHSWHLHSEEDV